MLISWRRDVDANVRAIRIDCYEASFRTRRAIMKLLKLTLEAFLV